MRVVDQACGDDPFGDFLVTWQDGTWTCSIVWCEHFWLHSRSRRVTARVDGRKTTSHDVRRCERWPDLPALLRTLSPETKEMIAPWLMRIALS